MRTLIYSSIIILVGLSLSSCEDYLDREPISTVSPEIYFTEVSQIQSYADNLYTSILPSHGTGWTYGVHEKDAGTDNQVSVIAQDRFTTDLWKVPNTESSNWKFDYIYKLNYALNQILPKFGDINADGSDLSGNGNIINGNLDDIKHYIGELFFLRACEYFNRYQMFGDFPIITRPLEDNKQSLIESNKRMPRNEVARFILGDLDKAIQLLSAKAMATTRINKDAALLLKSRVALFEGTWLKYFKGTAFVPNSEGWPGKSKEYNASYQFPKGSIEAEYNDFLEIAMTASKNVADRYKDKLVQNTGVLQQSVTDPVNPYYDMFAQEDLSQINEVLLWREYSRDLVTNNVCVAASWANNGVGVTKSFVNNFLMEDGTPVYRHGTYTDGDGYYMGDQTIQDVRKNRDSRLSIFLKEPGQKNILIEDAVGETANMVETIPLITNSDVTRQYVTGYALRKGGSFNQKYYSNGKGYTASISYRAAEALLNYMEASYERLGYLDNNAKEYWQIIRNRAGVSDDIEKTIASTDMLKEAENDWGAYSAGTLIDPTLYNIRRERRCEFLAEGLRYMDLCRWRSMDQLMSKPYIPEGIHLWNTPMESWYDNLLADGSDKATVSPKTNSEYIRPYQKNSKQNCYNGFSWKLAHYLQPIMVKQFLLTSNDNKSVETSPLYQNPYWPTIADMPAEQ
ncbi:RagB/SusD family nutrient uptake outer membrane protein [uncultured Bacteroides sp.]|uniref:RagB/SusD family nutrient uptake outer membrane protein n=1 Tax=uncultured Bacteroides sp. TaxID=162156 RepID=UPI0035A631CF